MLPRPMNPTVLLVLANGDFKNVFIYCTAIKPEYCLTALAAMKGVHIFEVQAILSQTPDHFSRLRKSKVCLDQLKNPDQL